LTARLPKKAGRAPMARYVVVALWGNGSIRVLTGFLMMFAAFAVKAETESSGQTGFIQLLLLGIIGAAAGVGGFLGNALGSRMQFGKPDQVIIACLASVLASTIVATVASGLATAALVGLVGSTASSLSKNSLDAVIQQDMPEESRASAFGRSETVLQLAWVFGGAIGLLLPPTYWIGFLVVSVLLALGLAQTWAVRSGKSLLPTLRRRPSPGPDPRPSRVDPPSRRPATFSSGTGRRWRGRPDRVFCSPAARGHVLHRRRKRHRRPDELLRRPAHRLPGHRRRPRRARRTPGPAGPGVGARRDRRDPLVGDRA